MKSETFTLSNQLNPADSAAIAQQLTRIDGVAEITAGVGRSTVQVDFNEDRTSAQELRAVLQKIGFQVKRAAHGTEGVCCGSCGG